MRENEETKQKKFWKQLKREQEQMLRISKRN